MDPIGKRRLFTAIRVIVSLSVAFLLIRNVMKSDADNPFDLMVALREVSRPLLAVAIFFYGAAMVASFYRWKLLLDVQGVRLPFLSLLRLGMVGVFFNLVVPGAIGGDLMKVVYIRSHAGPRATEAVTTIMLDRIIGLLGLFVVAVLFCGLYYRDMMALGPDMQKVTWGIFILAGTAIIGVTCMIFRETLQKLPGISHLLAVAASKAPAKITGIVVRVATALDIYKSRRGVILVALLMSCGIHLANGAVVFSLGRGFGETHVAANHYILATQVANTVGAVPIFPAGIGGRDKALKTYLVGVGADNHAATAVPIFFTFIMVFWSLVGGLFFLFSRLHPDPEAAASTAAAQSADTTPA